MQEYDWEGKAVYLGYKDAETMLLDLYVSKHLPVKDIARRLQMSYNVVRRQLAKYGIDVRQQGGANAVPKKRYFMHLMDQRLVFGSGLSLTARLLHTNPAYVWKYKVGVRGDYEECRKSWSTSQQRAQIPEVT